MRRKQLLISVVIMVVFSYLAIKTLRINENWNFIFALLLMAGIFLTGCIIEMKYKNKLMLMITGMVIVCICVLYNALVSWDNEIIHKRNYIPDLYNYTIDNDVLKCKDDMVSQKNYMARTIMFSLFHDKQTVVQENLENDDRVVAMVSSVRKEVRPLGLVRDRDADWYTESFSPQAIKYIYDDDHESMCYILTGEYWEQSDVIYITSDGEGNIWAIPEQLCYDNVYAGNEKPRKNAAHSSWSKIRSIVWEKSDDITMVRITQGGGKPVVVLKNILFIGVMTILGLCLTFALNIKFPIGLLCAPGIGCITEIVLLFLLGILNIPIGKTSFYLGLLAIIVGSLSMYIVKRVLKKKNEQECEIGEKDKRCDCFLDKSVLCGFVAIGVLIVLTVYFSIFPYTYLSGDSYANIFLGRYIVYNQEWKAIFQSISSFSLILPFVSTASELMGINIPYAFVPVFCLFGICSSVILYFMEKSHRRGAGIGMLLTILVIATPMFALSSFWYLNNMIIGIFYMLSLSLLFMDNKPYSKGSFIVACLFFAVASCARVEGPIIGALYLIAMERFIDIKRIKAMARVLLLTEVFLYVVNYVFSMDPNSDFWTIEKGTAVLAVCIVTYIYCCIVNREIIWGGLSVKNLIVYKYRYLIINGVCIAIAVCGYFYDAEKFNENLNSTIHNMFSSNMYGVYWVVLILLIAIIEIAGFEENRLKGIGEMLFLTVIFGFDIMLFRPYPISMAAGDSSNRMLMHAVPFSILFLLPVLELINANLIKCLRNGFIEK